jgi:hypothetical protein
MDPELSLNRHFVGAAIAVSTFFVPVAAVLTQSWTKSITSAVPLDLSLMKDPYSPMQTSNPMSSQFFCIEEALPLEKSLLV